jgi:phosphoglycerol transferase
MSGWPSGLIPNTAYPYTYQGDGLSHSWLAQRAIEGWIFDNPRSGYPFGSNFMDYPIPDTGSNLIIKFIAWISGNYHSAINIFFLFGFVTCFIASYMVLRAIGINQYLSFSAAMLFDFLPFHFLRLAHLYYTWYFIVPLFFYLAFHIYYLWDQEEKSCPAIPKITLIPVFLALGSFGIYYALFGISLLLIATVATWINNRSLIPVKWGATAICLVTAVLALNLVPNVIHRIDKGVNQEVAQRSPVEAEVYGFKLAQLVLPRADHRIDILGDLNDYYSGNYPLVNENYISTLGLIGATGFLILGFSLCLKLAGGRIDSRVSMLSLFVFILFLMGTVGGLGALFSLFVSSSLRAWNRVSVFIGFGSITAFFLIIQLYIEQRFSMNRAKQVSFCVAILALAIGLYDQTIGPCRSPCNSKVAEEFHMDRDFVKAIEESLPRGAAVYQLPYSPFPEPPPINELGTYSLAVGFLHSESLNWSYGGMKGRQGDLFYRALSKEPIHTQMDVIRKIGFDGVYVDLRGYSDKGSEIVDEISKVLGPATRKREDHKVLFFKVDNRNETSLYGLDGDQIMTRVGYFADRHGVRYEASIDSGIDFTRPDLPSFVKDITGLSEPEKWGRWSDANLGELVRIKFSHELPDRFSMTLKGIAFDKNAEGEVAIRIGENFYWGTLYNHHTEMTVNVQLGGESIDHIDIIPPAPTSPSELGPSPDERRLGVGLISLQFELE